MTEIIKPFDCCSFGTSVLRGLDAIRHPFYDWYSSMIALSIISDFDELEWVIDLRIIRW